MTERGPVDYLDYDDLIAVATAAVGQVVIRDAGGLASAATRPQTTIFGHDAYPGRYEKAAALLHSLARNHPLVDGNKRLAWVSARLFLDLNGVRSDHIDPDAAEALVLAVVAGTMDVPEIAKELARIIT